MDSIPSFSERHGFAGAPKPITIRYEAPEVVRQGVIAVAEKSGFNAAMLRNVICTALDEVPDVGQNWSYPNVIGECQGLLRNCEWFEVYEIYEALAQEAASRGTEFQDFQKNLNRFFEKKGVGWKMENGLLSIRGEEDYEKVTAEAQTALQESKRETAAGQLQEALRDLSRRPKPDITGAIQHSMAALECFAKDISGDSKKTLGDLIKGLKLPPPVDLAVEKMWGFASNQGRHITEGKEPDFPEALLTVHFCSALISYLSEKHE